MNIVFTGPAIDSSGNKIARSDLSQACRIKGFRIHAKVRSDTDIVVASRLDTSKAHSAALSGVRVMGYPEFIGRVLGESVLPTRGRVNLQGKAASRLALDLLVPDFTSTCSGVGP